MEKEKDKTGRLAIITIVDDGKMAGIQVQKNKMTDAEILGHLEIIKASIINDSLRKSHEKEKPQVTLEGDEIPKFDSGSTTLDG